MPPRHTISGRVARSDDKRKYFLSGHIDLPISHIRADGKIATDGTNSGELAIVLLDLVGPTKAHKLIDRFSGEVCDGETPANGRAVRSRASDLPPSAVDRLPEAVEAPAAPAAPEAPKAEDAPKASLKVMTSAKKKSKKKKSAIKEED